MDFSQQAKMQLAGLAVTLGLSVIGGLITGSLLKISFLSDLNIQSLFDDKETWLVNIFQRNYFFHLLFSLNFCKHDSTNF